MTIHEIAATNLDTGNGLLTAAGWSVQSANACIPEAGSLIAVNLSGLGLVAQKYGRAAGEAFLREVIQRISAELPQSGKLMQEAGNMLVIWFPQAAPLLVQEFIAHLRRILANPITLPRGESIIPHIIWAAIQVSPAQSIADALHLLEQELVSQPEFSAPPSNVIPSDSPRAALEHRLAALGLFGCDRLLERILTQLRLPSMQPVTIILSSPARGGKTRLLKGITRLLGGQHLPLAEVTCSPEDQLVPCALLAAVTYQLFTSFPKDVLRQKFAKLYQQHPWLAGILPLRAGEQAIAPPPPQEAGLLRQLLSTVLAEFARMVAQVAIVHHLELADKESLSALSDQQMQTGHGLRLILGVDQEEEDVAPVSNYFLTPETIRLRQPPLGFAEVRNYLRELIADTPPDEIVEALLTASGGRLLSVEMTLRDWTDIGVLQCHEGRWAFAPERLLAGDTAQLSEADRLRLCRAALACPAPLALLTALWQVSPEEARKTVDQGRAHGYLLALNFNAPDLVQFTDQDMANTLSAQLAEEERAAMHANIAALLEADRPADSTADARPLAYHHAQAGQAEQAQRYLDQIGLLAPALIPMLVAPARAAIKGAEEWEIPPADSLGSEDLDRICAAVLALRLAGVQLHLYPQVNDPARAAVQYAMQALQVLLRYRPSFIISSDGKKIAFDGQDILRRDLQLAMREIINWMSAGKVRAIGIARGVSEEELTQFLVVFVNHEPTDTKSTLLDKVLQLKLPNIKLLVRGSQPDPSQLNLPNLFNGGNGGAAVDERPNQSGGEERLTPAASAETGIASLENVPSLIDAAKMDERAWQDLPEMVEQAPAQVRGTLMANLTPWLGGSRSASSAVLDQIDTLLRQRLQRETDVQAFHETSVAVERRLDTLIARRDWPKIIEFVESLFERHQRETDAERGKSLLSVIQRVGEHTVKMGIIDQQIDEPAVMLQVRKLVSMLGEYALQPLIDALKNNTVMQERRSLLRVMNDLGVMQQPILLAELRKANPWYVYRNFLQVLAEVGTEEALTAITERMAHEDPRVRAEAVAAAVQIARGEAVNFLLQGLEDAHPSVRARAAGLIALCPRPRVLEVVLRLLQSRASDREGLDSVQLAACMGLGAFAEESAVDALIQILHPRMFSAYRGKGEEIRCATIPALIQHLPHPLAEAAIKQAMADKNMRVRQTAERAWQQYQRRNNIADT